MTEAEALQAAKMAKDRGISFEIAQKGELSDEKIIWPGNFSIWLQNPRTNMVHRLDEFVAAEQVCRHEDEINATPPEVRLDLDGPWRPLTIKW